MDKLQYIQEQLLDAKLRDELAKVVADVDALIPQSEEEFMELRKLDLYPQEECLPFVTRQGTPFYQLEVLYIMARMDSAEAHHWLKDNLFQGCRVDARKKTEYKAKFKEYHRKDWMQTQTEWMKYCLMLKYRDNALSRKDLVACRGKLPVEDAKGTTSGSGKA